MNAHHQTLLLSIKKAAGKPTQHTFLNNYLGTTHPRYPIDNPTLRALAKNFMRQTPMNERSLLALLTSLVKGKSFTEKIMAGFLLDYAGKKHWNFAPTYITSWLKHLEGWAEVDTLCTGKYSAYALPEHFSEWKKGLVRLSKEQQVEKRRASLVLCCAPLRKNRHEALLELTFKNIRTLQHEKDVLITKAISWVLRSAIAYHKQEVKQFLQEQGATLPKIAVRETLAKLKTGRKTPKKKASR